MAYLYHSSALYRAIVQATRNPRVLALFAVSTTGAFLLFGRAAQAITDPLMERKKHEIEHRVVNDAEAARYARHSTRAVATLFESLGKTRDEDRHHLDRPVRIPDVAWHPAVARRDAQQQQQQAEARAEAQAAASDEK